VRRQPWGCILLVDWERDTWLLSIQLQKKLVLVVGGSSLVDSLIQILVVAVLHKAAVGLLLVLLPMPVLPLVPVVVAAP
jgi:hypothetical protein